MLPKEALEISGHWAITKIYDQGQACVVRFRLANSASISPFCYKISISDDSFLSQGTLCHILCVVVFLPFLDPDHNFYE